MAPKKNDAPNPELEQVNETPEVESGADLSAEPAKDPHEGMVKVNLFKDDGKYASDVRVGVNGKVIQIKRGVDVWIPKAYAEVLDHSYRQRGKAADLSKQMQEEFASQVKHFS